MMHVRVRPAKQSDLPQILSLERVIATAPHWSQDAYLQSLVGGTDATRAFYVAVDGQSIVGFVVGRALAEGLGEVESIAVAERRRRLGVGVLLMQTILDRLTSLGAIVIELEVRAGSLIARRFYERFGFVQVGLRPRYYTEPDEDAVLLRRVPHS